MGIVQTYFNLFQNLLIGLMRGLAVPVLRRKTQYLGHELIIPKAMYSPWLKDHTFQKVYQSIKQYTLVDVYRCYELWTLIRELSHLQGNIIEVGVWRGGTGALIAAQSQNCDNECVVYLCDTFEGTVQAGEKDKYYHGLEHSDTNVKIVNVLINQLRLNNVKVLKGIFPEDTGKFVSHEKFKFCHIDVDVYNSARNVFEWIWNRLEIGGIVVFDDYGFPSCNGITEFVEEIRFSNDKLVIHNLNGHAVIIKINKRRFPKTF